jgi:hypothetical protein
MTILHVIARSNNDEAISLPKREIASCRVNLLFALIYLVGLLLFFQQVTKDLGVVSLIVPQAQE